MILSVRGQKTERVFLLLFFWGGARSGHHPCSTCIIRTKRMDKKDAKLMEMKGVDKKKYLGIRRDKG